jgi:hypothetical protein
LMYPARRSLPPFKVVHLDRLKILIGMKETWFVEDDLIPCRALVWSSRILNVSIKHLRNDTTSLHADSPRN